jgi:Ca-activated chloride channel homolog
MDSLHVVDIYCFQKKIRSVARLSSLIVLLSIFCSILCAQQTQVYKPNVSRILFVLDGSGSMKQQYDKASKFETAKQLLFKLIDSVERKNPNVEFAVRVFGFQNPNTQHNCKDSKLLLPFAKNNASKIFSELGKVTPQGMSPIAWSIQQGASDFPDDAHSLNSIILITDGEETCGGDPCKVSKDLLAKKITLKPFIVGLNVDSSAYAKFKCMGTFFNTNSEASFYNAVGVIIKQTLNTTTVQINLLDQNGNPTVTNIPFTLYDHYTGKIEYNFIHTMNEKGNPDTLYLDPVGIYDLELHTFPSIRKESIELTPGKHNIIALDVPVADMNVECIAASISSNNAQVLVRPKSNPGNILSAQDLNGQGKYLSGDYKLEILTNPEVMLDTTFLPYADNNFKIPNYGTLSLIAGDNYLASIYLEQQGGKLQMIESFEVNAKNESHTMQPGRYRLVYKPKKNYHSESTRTQQFVVDEGKTVVLNL